MAGFSSRGPRLSNGALKPEVVAPGVDVTAARAAGTELGPVVDEYYTTISGTSMATPHVAGLAAILKQEHPNWDGEQLKAAIANSTVPVADATGFDAGTGRVDALDAIHQDVLAPASLSLGSYAWPYSDLEPTRTTLTYTNTGSRAGHAVARPDRRGRLGRADRLDDAGARHGHRPGRRHRPRSTSSSTRRSPAPAPTRPSSPPPPTTAAARCAPALAYLLEPERYDVKVTIKPRAGSTQRLPPARASAASASRGSTSSARSTPRPTRRARPSGCRRAPTRTGAISFGLAADGAKEGVVTYDPSFTVSKNTEIVLDENETGRFDYKVDRPVVNDGAILDVGWNDGRRLHRLHVLRLRRPPLRAAVGGPAGGPATVAANWLLSQPEGLLTPAGQAGGAAAAHRPGGTPTETPVAAIDGGFRIVDAGSAARAADGQRVRGAVAVVSGTCGDLTGRRPGAAQKAGAAAMVAYAGRRSDAAPAPSRAGRGCRPCRLEPWPTPGRCSPAAARPAELTTHSSPATCTTSCTFWGDGVPAGGTVDGTGKSVAGPGRALQRHGQHQRRRHARGRGAGRLGARSGAVSPTSAWSAAVPFPTTVTHYVSTGCRVGAHGRGAGREYGGEYGRLYAPRTTYAGGSSTHDTWFGGPVGSRVSPLATLDQRLAAADARG